jgi:hypothetical protein
VLRSVTRRLRVLEFGITLQAATASTFGLGRPANTPAGGTNNAPLPGDPADAAALMQQVLAGWTTAPTAPTSFLRRWGFAATIGLGAIFTFPRLIIPVGGSIVLWNITATGVSDIYAVVEEL